SGSSHEVWTASPVATSHTFNALSRVAEARRLPSGAKATLETPWFGPRRVRSSSRRPRSHSFTVRSRLAEARQRPSGLHATARAAEEGALPLRRVPDLNLPLSGSPPVLAKRLPLGSKARPVTPPSCARSVARPSPLAASQTRRVPSAPPEARHLPSGPKATAV